MVLTLDDGTAEDIATVVVDILEELANVEPVVVILSDVNLYNGLSLVAEIVEAALDVEYFNI